MYVIYTDGESILNWGGAGEGSERGRKEEGKKERERKKKGIKKEGKKEEGRRGKSLGFAWNDWQWRCV